MFWSDFRKKRACSKSATKMLYRTIFGKWMHFQISLSLWELQVIRDWLCIRDFAETSLNRLLLFLMLKSHWSCYVEKGVLIDFTKIHFCWSLFLIKLQAWGPAAQVFSSEICKIFENTYFLKQLYLRVTLYVPCMKKKQLTRHN